MRIVFMNIMLKVVTIVILLATATACMQNDNPVWYFFDEPAIVTYNGSSVVLKTPYEPYPAPELDGSGLVEGQCLISTFILDYANSPLVASVINCFDVHNSQVEVRSGAMEDDFTDSIASAQILPRYVDAMLFFSFKPHTAVENAMYQYELVCNTDSITLGSNGKSVYGMYFRSKNVASGGAESQENKYYYAFDLGEFARTYQEDSLYINFYYYTKTHQDEEIYTAFKENPVRYKFPVPSK